MHVYCIRSYRNSNDTFPVQLIHSTEMDEIKFSKKGTLLKTFHSIFRWIFVSSYSDVRKVVNELKKRKWRMADSRISNDTFAVRYIQLMGKQFKPSGFWKKNLVEKFPNYFDFFGNGFTRIIRPFWRRTQCEFSYRYRHFPGRLILLYGKRSSTNRNCEKRTLLKKKKKRLPVAFLAAWYIWLRYFMTFLTEKYVSRIVNFHMNINTLYSINLAKLLCKSNSEQWINVFEKRNFVKNVMSYISECLFFKLKCRVLVLTKRNVRYVINFHVPTLTLLVSNSFHQCDEWLDKLNNMKNELCWRNWRLRSGCFVNWNCMFHLLDFGEEINSAGWFDWSNRSLWPALLWMLITVWLAVN